jgi:hypothetical protein
MANGMVIHRVIHMASGRVKDKAKRPEHKPPARVRYEESHPTMSCRLSKDEYDLLRQRLDDLGGVSFADFVKDSLGLLQVEIPETKDIKGKARRAGYDQGRREHQIWYYCSVCQQRIDVAPNSESHKAVISCMKERGWGHKSCHGQ